MERPDVVVIGAGVIGLTTAICLAEGGMRPHVRTAAPPERTTSAVAGALCGPAFLPPDDPARQWERESVATFFALADHGEDTGVHVTRGRCVAPFDGAPPPVDDVHDPAPIPREELPPGARTGVWATSPLVDMGRYLPYLRRRLEAAGGTVEQAPVQRLEEAASVAPLVANCAGIGAVELTGDPQLRPRRGQHVIAVNPGIDHYFVEASFTATWASWMPHGDRIVLGGTADDDAWDTTPDPEVTRGILARCAAVEPRLADVEVLDVLVGLRPARPRVRLELEEVGGARVVHDYGHGGLGVTLSWGCARAAAALLTG